MVINKNSAAGAALLPATTCPLLFLARRLTLAKMDRLEIVAPRSNGEAVFQPASKKSAFWAHKTPQGIGKNDYRRREKILDVNHESL